MVRLGGLQPRNGDRHGVLKRALRRGFAALAIAALPLSAGVRGLTAQTTTHDGTPLDVGGYVRSLTGTYRLGYDAPGQDRTSSFNAEVVRLTWRLMLGEGVVVQIHNRIQGQFTSTEQGFGSSVAGFGVTAVPDRTLDLSSDIVTRPRARVWHDVDRLSLSLQSRAGDLTVGRQAITWGISSLFPIADLWAQFSPFELDTEEKPGVDAVRFLAYPGSGWELDLVVADRGSLGDLSVGVRASRTASWADLHFAGGKLWNQLMAMAGVSAPVGSWKLRAEGVLPYDLDADEVARLRATLGVDWLLGEWVLTGEYHHNGVGAEGPEGYAAVLSDARLARGESYYLGRHYAGGVVAWTPGNDRLSLVLNGMVNLQDPSTAVTQIVSYDLGQNTRISAGVLVTAGDEPTFAPAPSLRSEYGAYGNLLFVRASYYF